LLKDCSSAVTHSQHLCLQQSVGVFFCDCSGTVILIWLIFMEVTPTLAPSLPPEGTEHHVSVCCSLWRYTMHYKFPKVRIRTNLSCCKPLMQIELLPLLPLHHHHCPWQQELEWTQLAATSWCSCKLCWWGGDVARLQASLSNVTACHPLCPSPQLTFAPW